MSLYGQNIGHETWLGWQDFNPNKFKAYFKFAVIRDPISRFVSAFYYLKRGGMNPRDKNFSSTVLKSFDTPSEFAKSLIDAGAQIEAFNYYHFRPQVDFVTDRDGRSKMDLLIGFDKLEEGFKLVARKLELADVTLPHFNKAPQDQSGALDRDAIDVLGCLYRRDFALWKEITS